VPRNVSFTTLVSLTLPPLYVLSHPSFTSFSFSLTHALFPCFSPEERFNATSNLPESPVKRIIYLSWNGKKPIEKKTQRTQIHKAKNQFQHSPIPSSRPPTTPSFILSLLDAFLVAIHTPPPSPIRLTLLI